MTITMAHLNPIEVSDSMLRVDRKFHSGMLRYSEALVPHRIQALNPKIRPGQQIMDPIELSISELPYVDGRRAARRWLWEPHVAAHGGGICCRMCEHA